MSRGLVIDVEVEADYVVVRVCGRLSLRTIPRVRETAIKTLLSAGRVVVDLSCLRCSQSVFLAVFPTALAMAGGWPSARLVLCGADATLQTMLVSSRITETVLLAVDLASARTLLDQRPPVVRRYRDLSSCNTAPAVARRFVRQVCGLWAVSAAVQEVAELVATELVTNAVVHAHSGSRLTITYTESALFVSVRDYLPTVVPRPRLIEVSAPRGRGLHFVAALAHAWGVDQHPDGKKIWVCLALDTPG